MISSWLAGRPADETEHRLGERAAEFGGCILDPRRDLGVGPARDEPVALEVAERLGEHAMRDSVDAALQFGEPQRVVVQEADDEQTPLVANAREHVADDVASGVLVAARRGRDVGMAVVERPARGIRHHWFSSCDTHLEVRDAR